MKPKLETGTASVPQTFSKLKAEDIMNCVLHGFYFNKAASKKPNSHSEDKYFLSR